MDEERKGGKKKKRKVKSFVNCDRSMHNNIFFVFQLQQVLQSLRKPEQHPRISSTLIYNTW